MRYKLTFFCDECGAPGDGKIELDAVTPPNGWLFHKSPKEQLLVCGSGCATEFSKKRTKTSIVLPNRPSILPVRKLGQ